MLISRTTHVSLCALALACLTVAPSRTQETGAWDRAQYVPESVMAASARPGPPEQLAHALAMLGVPAGFILGKAHEGGEAVPLNLSAPLGTHRLSDALASFRAGHPDYRVDDDDGGLFIAPVTSACAQSLQRTVDVQQAGRLNEVLFAVARTVDASLPDVPAGLVIGGGSPPPAEMRLLRRPVNLVAKQAVLRSVLMDLSRQVRGVVWGIREDAGNDAAPPSCIVTLMTANVTLNTSYDFR